MSLDLCIFQSLKFVVFWLVKFEFLTEMLPIGNSKVANWQLFEQFQFWLDKS